MTSSSPSKASNLPDSKPSPIISKPSNKSSSHKFELVVLGVAVALIAIILGGLNYYVQEHFGGNYVIFKNEVLSQLGIIDRRKASGYVGPEPGVHVCNQSAQPEKPVRFTVHFNGDGLGSGIAVTSSAYDGLDDLIIQTCETFVAKDPLIDVSRCDPKVGARIYTHTGVRIYSFLDIKHGARTYIVPQGTHFVYPLANVGDVIYPESVKSPMPERPIKMTQLSQSPRVFTIENFVTPEELDGIIAHNKEMVRPSEVGFSGWRDKTRTSSTSWDFTSKFARSIQQRSFDLVGMAYDARMADAVQVLRYENTEWYKPHTDYFDSKGFDNSDPTVNNGTNRFATVFVYLSDVEEGGHTVFPLSTTHLGYNGEQLVHKGTERTAGYIADRDAAWVCNTSSTALRTTPVAGSAVLFYSQGPKSELDKYSLHGGCPVIKGIKWSANVWLWNRPKPSKEEAKDKDEQKKAKEGGMVTDNGAISVRFHNNLGEKIKLYWDDGTDEMMYQNEIDADDLTPMTTYQGHRFVAKSLTGKVLGEYRANMSHNDNEVEFKQL